MKKSKKAAVLKLLEQHYFKGKPLKLTADELVDYLQTLHGTVRKVIIKRHLNKRVYFRGRAIEIVGNND